ncbi:MAG: GNAT family N-acetyltransferase [Candidatus Thorarchaeota archaeon]|jgi:GNAT superfamily N-acetyltransferase
MRSFHWSEDFDLVRNFLIETYNLTHTFQNWIPSMFENRKFGPGGSEYTDEDDEQVKLWEELDNQAEPKIVAVTICKPSGYGYIQIHPHFRSLEKELVLFMEKQRKSQGSKDTSELELKFTVAVSDDFRRGMLEELGYENLGVEEHNRIRPLDLAVPEYELPKGYEIRPANIMEEFHKYRTLQASVFHHMANMTENLAHVYSTAEFYNPELDLVAVDPNGNFAAFCTVRIDPISKMAELEPVGTHPDYRKLGLAKAIICEALRRAREYHPSVMVILGAAPIEGATRLYDSIGFSREDVHLWSKKL